MGMLSLREWTGEWADAIGTSASLLDTLDTNEL
jgi:hypothetical protein